MTDPNTPRTTEVEHWRTSAVTALPSGWVNVFEESGKQIAWPCPAILLQQLVAITTIIYYPDRRVGESKRVCEEPYETRAVFANSDFDSGELTAAHTISNYVGTDYRPDLPNGAPFTDLQPSGSIA